MLARIKKRDFAFDKKIKLLPADWLNYNSLLILNDKCLGMAEHWKFILHHSQRDAAKSLFYANSNQHRVGHRVIRRNDNIVLSGQIVEKAYYLRYCVVLLQSCGDKLAQLIRCSMDIKTWKSEKNKRIKAKESTTTLMRLITHLTLSEKKDNILLADINSYLKNESVNRILRLANEIKHKWITSYQGEGLYPLRNPVRQEKDNKGNPVEVTAIGMTNGIDIESHIADALITNNMLVELAVKIDKLLLSKGTREGRNG